MWGIGVQSVKIILFLQFPGKNRLPLSSSLCNKLIKKKIFVFIQKIL